MNFRISQPFALKSWLRRVLPAVCASLLSFASWAAAAATFSNPTNISINPAGGPPGVTPYPSPITVSGLAGAITNVTVTVTNLSHTNPDDLDILLLGPGGQRVLLMSDAGGPNDINSVRLTFSDDASAVLPDTNRIVSGTYRPTNYPPGETNFPAGTPGPPYSASLSVFDGTNPNGTWRLFVHDDTGAGGGGSIVGGWLLNLSVAVFPPVIVNQPQDQTVPAGGTAVFQVSVSGTPPFGYQWLHNTQVIVPYGQGGSTLTVAAVNASDVGSYSVFVTNAANPNGVRSADAVLTIAQPVVIVSQPQDQTVPPGGTVVFQVGVTGTPPFSYVWLYNGQAISPVSQSGPTLTVSNVTAADAGIYSVIVANAASPNGVRSADARLTLATPVSIISQPQDQTVAPGGTAIFRVTVTGTSPFGYQWLRNGQVILPFGQGGRALTLSNVTAAAAGDYSVVVTNPASPNGVHSAKAFLNVLGPLTIAAAPSNVVVFPGATVQLCVTAAGRPPFRYQWTLNGEALPNQTDNCLVLRNVSPKSGGNFQVVVWNDDEAITTEPAFVVVRADTAGPVPTDKFDDRPTLQGPQGIVQGDSSLAGTEPGEPVLRGGGKSVWFQWFAPDTGIVTLAARGSTFDTLLAVYTGARVENLTLVTKDDDRAGFYTSSLKFNAEQGRLYQIQLDGFGRNGAGGSFTVCWDIERTNHLIPIILTEPSPQGVRPGGVATFRVQTDGQPVLYQWFFNGTPIPGATDNVYSVIDAKPVHVGHYVVRIMNREQRVLFSEAADLQLGSFNFPVTSDKLENVFFGYRAGGPSGGGAGAGGFSAAAGGSLGIGYMSIGLGNLVSNVWAPGGLRQPGDPSPCGNPFLGTTWRGLTATNSGIIQVDTIGSLDLARLAVYRFATNTGLLSSMELVCDVSSAASGQPVVATFNAQQGSNYCVVVDDLTTNFTLILHAKMGTAPALINPMQYCLVSEGGSITLNMPATNWCPLPTCQWLSNGVAIAGATGPTLLVDNFQEGKVGTYSVKVSNFVDTTTRDVAYLALAGPFTLNHWWTTNMSAVGFVINASNSAPFVLETTTNLNGSWSPIATNPNACSFLFYTNAGALTDPRRFFRAAPWTPPGP